MWKNSLKNVESDNKKFYMKPYLIFLTAKRYLLSEKASYVEGIEEQFYGSSYSCRSIHGDINLMALISDPFILSSVFTFCRVHDFPCLSVGVHTWM